MYHLGKNKNSQKILWELLGLNDPKDECRVLAVRFGFYLFLGFIFRSLDDRGA